MLINSIVVDFTRPCEIRKNVVDLCMKFVIILKGARTLNG